MIRFGPDSRFLARAFVGLLVIALVGCAPQAPTPASASAQTTENTSREMKSALAFQARSASQASLLKGGDMTSGAIHASSGWSPHSEPTQKPKFTHSSAISARQVHAVLMNGLLSRAGLCHGAGAQCLYQHLGQGVNVLLDLRRRPLVDSL